MDQTGIRDYTATETRRYLAIVRKAWADKEQPFIPTAPITRDGVTMEEFCVSFILRKYR